MINARLKKISAALYRVTDLMNDEEPMKWSLRRQAIRIMREASLLENGGSFKDKVIHGTAIEYDVKEMFDLLDIASSVSFISQVNYDVLAREYKAFLRNVRVEDDEVTLKLSGTSTSSGRGEAAQTKKNIERMDTISFEHSAKQERAIAAPSTGFSAETVARTPVSTQKNTERSARIVDFLRSHEWASRGDILRIFGSEISEKTLQRELSAMISAGDIVKRGEKRWCRYSLNNS